MAELTAFVRRSRQRYRPGSFVDFELHDAETLLRNALGEAVCVAAMPKKLKHGTFLLVNLIGELALPADDFARLIAEAESSLVKSGHAPAPLPDAPLD